MHAVLVARRNDAASLKALVAAGTVRTGVKVARHFAENAVCCTRCCDRCKRAFDVLGRLAATVPGSAKAASAGAAELALRAIAAEGGGDDEAGITTYAMCLLSSLALVEPGAARLAACDGAGTILAVLRRPRGAWGVQAFALGALANLCGMAAMARAARAGTAAVPAVSFTGEDVAAVMARHAGNPYVQSSACKALIVVWGNPAVRAQTEPAAVAAGCVELCAAALEAFPNDASVQQSALYWPAVAAGTPSTARRISAARIPLAAFAALRVLAGNPAVCAAAFFLLHRVIDHSEAPWAAAAAAEAAAHGSLGQALEASGRFPGHADLQNEALSFAYTMLALQEPAALAAGPAWAAAALAAMRAHGGDSRVQTSGANVLSELAWASAALAAAAVRAGAVDAVLAAAGRHTDSAMVISSCCGCLRAIASEHRAAVGAIVAGGGLEAAVAALARHREANGVVSYASSLLCALLEIQPDLAGRTRRIGAANEISPTSPRLLLCRYYARHYCTV